jgi:hypothetical protein
MSGGEEVQEPLVELLGDGMPCPWPTSCHRAHSAKSDTPALVAAGTPAAVVAVAVAAEPLQ